jgi:Family of unknown function (DUF5681)
MVARLCLNPSSARKGTERNYRKPPKASQFKPGQSGNPKGRPKGVRNFETDLDEALRALVEVKTNGGVRRITMQKALLQTLAEKARDGDLRAIQHLSSLILRLMDSRSEAPATVLESNDRAILDEYYEERKALEAGRAASGSLPAEPAVVSPATTDGKRLA